MLKGILSYGFVEGFSKLLNKLNLLILPMILTTTSFGKIGIIVALEVLLPVILLFGMERAVLRFYFDRSKIENMSGTIFWAITFFHLMLGFIWLISYLIGIEDFLGLYLFPDYFLIIILVYLQGLILIKLNKLRSESMHNDYFKLRLFFQLGKLVAIIGLVLIFNNYLSYLYGSLIASISIIIYINFFKGDGIVHKFKKQTFFYLATFSWPFVFHGIAGNILGTFDKFILESNLSLEIVGKYTLAYTIGSAVTFTFVGLSVYIEPLVYKENNELQREGLLDKYLALALLFGVIVVTVILTLSNYLIPQFYSDSYLDSVGLIEIIAISHLFIPFYTISNYRLAFEKKTKKIASISILCSIINVMLNILLIPVIGVEGAVFATLISYGLLALIFTAISYKSSVFFNKQMIALICLISCFVFLILLEIQPVIYLTSIFLFLIFYFFNTYIKIFNLKVNI